MNVVAAIAVGRKFLKAYGRCQPVRTSGQTGSLPYRTLNRCSKAGVVVGELLEKLCDGHRLGHSILLTRRMYATRRHTSRGYMGRPASDMVVGRAKGAHGFPRHHRGVPGHRGRCLSMCRCRSRRACPAFTIVGPARQGGGGKPRAGAAPRCIASGLVAAGAAASPSTWRPPTCRRKAATTICRSRSA